MFQLAQMAHTLIQMVPAYQNAHHYYLVIHFYINVIVHVQIIISVIQQQECVYQCAHMDILVI